jgi:hypothetical protein
LFLLTEEVFLIIEDLSRRNVRLPCRMPGPGMRANWSWQWALVNYRLGGLPGRDGCSERLKFQHGCLTQPNPVAGVQGLRSSQPLPIYECPVSTSQVLDEVMPCLVGYAHMVTRHSRVVYYDLSIFLAANNRFDLSQLVYLTH